ncbi:MULTISPECIES: PTS glucitol/sorbitol transporter subunit IIA [Enterococcus]|uniref:PTS glucitol/sorbitol transporter subunit IIA n=1 Tax=Candidatus Enterococcus murrayae TaxID=2815321 RepID=A0ABS3HI20_9ENTE|nr:PTS glucitol/sorbitol transporter subunit IIA [Enterococcus sp. MJM16]MBO0453106.1 PTS glucitol/sorbitol transporter subunit IIA [Enterococcus sp. MJM16]
MTVTEITQIGKHAINDENILVLFGETITPDLLDVSIVQKKLGETTIELKKGGQLIFGDQSYQVNGVGPLANENLNEIGHATVFFQEEVGVIPNGIYVTPEKLPDLEVGMKISYQ